MSVRYINDRFLPDKAIDIIDEAASKVQLAGYRPSPKAEALEREIHDILKQKEQAVINADLEGAKAAQAKQNEAEAKIEEATRQAANILAEAKSQAEKQREEMIQEAYRTAAGIIVRAESERDRMRLSMFNEIRDEVADLAVAIASKVIGQTLDSQRQRELIEQYLNESMIVSASQLGNQSEVTDHD